MALTSKYVMVRNWARLQHYSNRNPPWIKLYTNLLDDDEFEALSDAQRFHLLGIFMLAARRGNKLLNNAKWIAKKIDAEEVVDMDALAPWLTDWREDASEPASKDASNVLAPTDRQRQTERQTRARTREDGVAQWDGKRFRVAPSRGKALDAEDLGRVVSLPQSDKGTS